MKFTILFLTVSSAAVRAQATAFETPKPRASAQLSPDTVLATVEGRKLTYGDVQKYMSALPPQMRQSAMANRKQLIQQLALMQRLSELAEKEKLDQQSPYKEALAFNRINVLSQAKVNEMYNGYSVQLEEQKKFYDEHKNRYEQVKVKVIYIPFHANAGKESEEKRALTEEQAKEKAEHLVKEIKGGADFVKVVKENSEDATSKAKDGDFGTISRTDNLPEAIHTKIFALKTGEVSDPVRQPNGFYIFRAEEISSKSFDEVQEQISGEVKNAHLKQWLATKTKELDIKFEDNDFFSGAALPGAGAPRPNP